MLGRTDSSTFKLNVEFVLVYGDAGTSTCQNQETMQHATAAPTSSMDPLTRAWFPSSEVPSDAYWLDFRFKQIINLIDRQLKASGKCIHLRNISEVATGGKAIS